MTVRAISTACPPALGRVGAPRPCAARGNRSVPWPGSASRSAGSGRFGPSCCSASHPTGPNKPDQGSPNTDDMLATLGLTAFGLTAFVAGWRAAHPRSVRGPSEHEGSAGGA